MNFQKRNLRLNLITKQTAPSSSTQYPRNNSFDNKHPNPTYTNPTNNTTSPIQNLNNISYQEEENQKIKSEARELIAKTRKMMQELSLDQAPHTAKSTNRKKRSSPTKSTIVSLNNNNNISSSLTIPYTNLNNNANTCSIDSSLTQKLLIKNKQIKLLEKELKDRTTQLKIAQDKLQTKNEEIQKLNEALTLERSNTLKAENVKLQRKVFAIEKANEENKRLYEKMIEELKEKLNNISIQNVSNEKQINLLEQENKRLKSEVDKLKKINEDKANVVKQLNEKNAIEKKVNEKYKHQINDLKLNLSNLCVLIKTLYTKENECYSKHDTFVNKFKHVFNCNSINNDNSYLIGSTMSSNNDCGYDRKHVMNNQHCLDKIKPQEE